MYLWNAAHAAGALRENRLTERDKLAYLLLGSTLQFVIGADGLLSVRRTLGGVLIFLALLGINLLGLVRAFQLNQQGDNVYFLERCIVLLVPLLVQFYAIYLGFVAIAYMATGYRLQDARYFLGAVYGIALVWLYRRLAKCVAHAARAPGFDVLDL